MIASARTAYANRFGPTAMSTRRVYAPLCGLRHPSDRPRTHAEPGSGYVSDPTLGTDIDVSHAGRSPPTEQSPETEPQGDRGADEDQRGPGERRVDRRKVARAEICRHGCGRGFVSALCRIPRDAEGLDVHS